MTIISDKIGAFKPTNNRVVAIVVTYNRKDLLVSVIDALLNQSMACDIIIVDNASIDGTKNLLSSQGIIGRKRVNYIRMEKNIGGAGGFSQGLKIAMNAGWDWFWLMDDDAIPEPDAMESLSKYAQDPDTVYGSIAINKSEGRTRLCWPSIIRKNGRKRFIKYPEMLADAEEVDMIPFIGFLLHRNLVERVGYPDSGYFICADDKEYCERIKSKGFRLTLIKASKVNHPLPNISLYNFGLFQAAYRELPTWKMYYDVRNKIFIAKKYFPNRLYFQTIPGILIRALLGILKKGKAKDIFKMTSKAIIDGLLTRKGKKILPPF